jgi:uncharacterized OB-fold protein
VTPTMTNALRLVDDSLFVSPEGALTGRDPRLAGSVCPACGTTTFPVQASCPKCGAIGMRQVALPPEGTLWAFTVQGFEPKPPFRSTGSFTPYGVGYIDLGDVLVETRLTESDPGRLRNGDPMRLQLVPVFCDEDGTQVMTFAFGPVRKAEVRP